jgi:hypothetical protein
MYQNDPTFGAAAMQNGLVGGARPNQNSSAGMSDKMFRPKFDSGEGVIADDSGMAGLGSDDFGQPSGDFWNRPPRQFGMPGSGGNPRYRTDDQRRQQRMQQMDQDRDLFAQKRQQLADDTLSKIPAHQQLQALQGQLKGGRPNPEQEQQLKSLTMQIQGDPSFMKMQGQQNQMEQKFQQQYGGQQGGYGRQMQNPFMGGGGFGSQQGGYGQQMQNPFMGGGGYGQQMQNPFMGGGGYGGQQMSGGMGGYGQQMQNPFMGGGYGGQQGGYGGQQSGYGQQMRNPFMGGGYGQQMGGGMGGYGQQMQNPFMGGGGMGGYGQQMQNPFMGGGGQFGGQQMQQPMQLQRAMGSASMQQPMQQQQQPMGYQGGAF